MHSGDGVDAGLKPQVFCRLFFGGWELLLWRGFALVIDALAGRAAPRESQDERGGQHEK
jgi:hypothetical protein